MKLFVAVFLAVFLSAAAPTVLLGQVGNASLSGTVRDESGAVIPRAQVTATNVATGVAKETVTTGTGIYVIPNLKLLPRWLAEASTKRFSVYPCEQSGDLRFNDAFSFWTYTGTTFVRRVFVSLCLAASGRDLLTARPVGLAGRGVEGPKWVLALNCPPGIPSHQVAMSA